jgi:hypothetical protein
MNRIAAEIRPDGTSQKRNPPLLTGPSQGGNAE